MNPSNFLQQIRQAIAKDELENALQQLHQLLQNTPKLDEITLQSARFHAIRKQIRIGVINPEKADLTQNQIRASLLELLQVLEKEVVNPPINKEITNTQKISIPSKAIHQQAEKIYNIEKIDNANFS